MIRFNKTFDPDVFSVVWEEGCMTIGAVGLMCGKWYVTAEDASVCIEKAFDTKEEAGAALFATVGGPKRETPALRIIR